MSDDIKILPLNKLFDRPFDKTNQDDMIKLTMAIQERGAKDPRFKDYTVLRVDENKQIAIIGPMSRTFEDEGGDASKIKPIAIEPSQGADLASQKKTVADLQAAYQGWIVTDFIRPSTSKCIAQMEQLDEKTVTSRQLFAAALGLNSYPWAIRISRTTEGGWRIRIKEGVVTYQSKYDAKMQEAVDHVAGKPGWFFRTDPEKGVIMVYPGTPPTFPKKIACPKSLYGKNDLHHSYLGMKLPDRGRETGDWIALDWQSGPGIMVAAAANSGKSVVINTIISAALEAGFQLAICDDEDKSVDFQWCRDYVIDHGWGCDSPEAACATLIHILEICSYRAKLIKQYGAENWWGLPDDLKKKNPLLLLVCDEVAQWAGAVTVPKVSKDNPMRIRAEYEASVHASNVMYSMKITQKARFSGVCFLFCGQSVRLQDGFDPGMRVNLTTVISPTLQPAEAVEDLLGGAKRIPDIPENILQPGISRGAGLIRLPGLNPIIYKGFYEDAPGKSYSEILRERVMKVRKPEGGPTAGHWAWNEIVDIFPTAAEKPDDGDDGYEKTDDENGGDGFPTDGFGEDGRDVADRDAPLRGAAKAAHVSALEQLRAAGRLASEKGM